jgi:DNA polymerase III epsilon subunit family exonuclease
VRRVLRGSPVVRRRKKARAAKPKPSSTLGDAVSRPIEEVTFSFLDTETTGLSSSRGGRVCELAILRVKGGEVIDSFQELIDPQVPIEFGAQSVHGITDAMVRGKPTFRKLAPRVVKLLEGTVMVCHNAPFDESFMRAEFERAGSEMPDVPILCTLKLARRHFSFERNNLGTIAKALDVETKGWHRAGADVAMLDKIFRYFLKEFSMRGTSTLGELVDL